MPNKTTARPDPQATLDAAYRAIREARQTPGADLDRLQSMLQSEADNLWLADYRATLEGLVKDATEACSEGSTQDLSDWLHETVDGSSLIIYNATAANLLRLSRNDDAYDLENGESGASVNVRAFYAMEADLRQALEEAGADLSARTMSNLFPTDPEA